MEITEVKQPKVTLIQSPVNLLETLYTACRTCYSSLGANELWNSSIYTDKDEVMGVVSKEREQKMIALVTKVLNSGHTSIAGHVSFTFAIDGVSRALTHQLVRHIFINQSQKSQRYVQEKGLRYIMPKKIAESKLIVNDGLTGMEISIQEDFQDFMHSVADKYEQYLRLGFEPEDARSVLPNATETSIVSSMNLREFIHVMRLRRCVLVQDEFRTLANKMAELVLVDNPWMKDLLKPECDKCTDFRGCKKSK